jgi:hypothetical protein
MLPKKPVTPFTRYSTPAILAACLPVWLSSFLLSERCVRDAGQRDADMRDAGREMRDNSSQQANHLG